MHQGTRGYVIAVLKGIKYDLSKRMTMKEATFQAKRQLSPSAILEEEAHLECSCIVDRLSESVTRRKATLIAQIDCELESLEYDYAEFEKVQARHEEIVEKANEEEEMNTCKVISETEAKAVRKVLDWNGLDAVHDATLVMQSAVLRVGDVLKLKFEDVVDGGISIEEEKTGKRKNVSLHPGVLAMVERRKAAHPHHVYLFQSVKRTTKGAMPITREYVSREIAKAAKEAGVAGTVAAHSFRKCGGNTIYQNSGCDLVQAMVALNHSNTKETLHYLEITEQKTNSLMHTIDL
jgi:integrase